MRLQLTFAHPPCACDSFLLSAEARNIDAQIAAERGAFSDVFDRIRQMPHEAPSRQPFNRSPPSCRH